MGVLERREREKSQRVEAIVAAARKLFATKGVRNTTMEDIAREAELGKGTLYLYFPNREELAFAVMARAFRRLRETLEKAAEGGGTAFERVRRVAAAYVRFASEKSEDFRFTHYFDYSLEGLDLSDSRALACSAEMEAIVGMVKSLAEEGKKDGSMRSDLNVDLMAAAAIHMVDAFMRRLAAQGELIRRQSGYEPQQLVEYLVEMLLTAIKAPAAPDSEPEEQGRRQGL